jgi:hypothetical protein
MKNEPMKDSAKEQEFRREAEHLMGGFASALTARKSPGIVRFLGTRPAQRQAPGS